MTETPTTPALPTVSEAQAAHLDATTTAASLERRVTRAREQLAQLERELNAAHMLAADANATLWHTITAQLDELNAEPAPETAE